MTDSEYAFADGSVDSGRVVIESQDGKGAGDHDMPYRFGRRPRALATFPFTERQYARLLIMRSRLQGVER